MNRDVTHKIYGPKRSWDPYTVLWVTDRSISCHLARSAMNYLLYYIQYMQICQTTCFCYFISKTKKRVRTKSGRKHYIDLAQSILYTYWLGMRVIALLLSPRYQLFSEATPRTIVGTGDNKSAITRISSL
jgi:hypothetical protein